MDEHIEAPVEKWVQSACVMCSYGECLFRSTQSVSAVSSYAVFGRQQVVERI